MINAWTETSDAGLLEHIPKLPSAVVEMNVGRDVAARLQDLRRPKKVGAQLETTNADRGLTKCTAFPRRGQPHHIHRSPTTSRSATILGSHGAEQSLQSVGDSVELLDTLPVDEVRARAAEIAAAYASDFPRGPLC